MRSGNLEIGEKTLWNTEPTRNGRTRNGRTHTTGNYIIQEILLTGAHLQWESRVTTYFEHVCLPLIQISMPLSSHQVLSPCFVVGGCGCHVRESELVPSRHSLGKVRVCDTQRPLRGVKYYQYVIFHFSTGLYERAQIVRDSGSCQMVPSRPLCIRYTIPP